jgi:hypothetical protein
MSETNMTRRLEAFKKDLDTILEKHGFTGLYRKVIEDNCIQIADQQINKKAIAAYKKSQEDEDGA